MEHLNGCWIITFSFELKKEVTKLFHLYLIFFSGHKSSLFAFSEKTKNGRIIIATYPKFKILAELKGEFTLSLQADISEIEIWTEVGIWLHLRIIEQNNEKLKY